jgi:hypothetical protein
VWKELSRFGSGLMLNRHVATQTQGVVATREGEISRSWAIGGEAGGGDGRREEQVR